MATFAPKFHVAYALVRRVIKLTSVAMNIQAGYFNTVLYTDASEVEPIQEFVFGRSTRYNL